MLLASNFITNLPAEIRVYLARYLDWRDLCALLHGTDFDLRVHLSESELRRCVAVNGGQNTRLAFASEGQHLSVRFLSLCSPQIFFEEYLWIGRRLQTFHLIPAPVYAVKMDDWSMPVATVHRSEFHFHSILQASFHPSERVIAFVLKDETECESTVFTKCSLMVKHFGSPKAEWSSTTIFLENDNKLSNRMHFSGEMRCSWSPCGDFLSTTETSTLYNGPQAQAKVQIFVFNRTVGSLKNIENLAIVVNARSISGNLWIGPGKLVLPDPLDRGDEPSVLILDQHKAAATLLRPSVAGGQKFYNYPSGMLTGFADGRAAFVTCCEKSTAVIFRKAQCYLSEHEHQRVVVLDSCQKRLAEIDVPGIVIQISERNGKVCLLYRDHVGASFGNSRVKIAGPSSPDPEAAVPEFARNPKPDCSRVDQLSYHSYPRYCQPHLNKMLSGEQDARKKLGSPCKLYLHQRTPETQIPLRKLRAVLGAPPNRKYLAAAYFSSPADTESEEESEAPQKSARVEKIRGGGSDQDDDEFPDWTGMHPVIGRVTGHYYAEVDLTMGALTYFSQEKLFKSSACLGPAYEARSGKLGNPFLNQSLLLATNGRRQPATISNSVVLVNSRELYSDEYGTTALLRNHPNLPAFVDQEYRTIQLDPENMRYTRTYSGFGNLSDTATILSMVPGRDESEADLSYRVNKSLSYRVAEAAKFP